MDKGPFIIPLVPGGIPIIIHVSQNEFGDMNNYDRANRLNMYFKFLTSDNTFYQAKPGNSGGYHTAGRIYFTRPDGETYNDWLGNALKYVGGGNVGTVIPDTFEWFQVDGKLTEVAGDVSCEIILFDWENMNYPNVLYNDPLKFVDENRNISPYVINERTANFIVRVEPRPAVLSMAHYTISGVVNSGSNDPSNNGVGSYYEGDEIDNSLLTWGDVVSAADTGSLFDILEPGTLIQPVRLSSGEMMGLRCVHIDDYRTAIFEPYHLFLAPKIFNNTDSEKAAAATMEDAPGNALSYLGDKSFENRLTFKGQTWISNLPYEVRSRVDMYKNHLVREAEIFGGTYMQNGVQIEARQLDLYKTASGRIKTSTDGIARRWHLNGLTSDGWMGVSESGALDFRKIGRSDDVYVNPLIKLTGKEHEDPTNQPVDIQSWQDVKTAAAAGKLKNSNLELGQLMPELPTVGVLRCVHIEDSWAAFDMTQLYKIGTIHTIPINIYADELTDEEKDIFTTLGSSGSVYIYARYETPFNVAYTTNGAGIVLNNMIFDYYKSGDETLRVKHDRDGKAVGWWSYWDSTWKSFYSSSNGQVQTYSSKEYSGMTQYGAYVFVVGEIS